MKKNKSNSVQKWLFLDSFLEDGFVKLKDGSYIKIIKVQPINYNLKSSLEKEAILNSYKIFLKTCGFDMQILIQTNKEDLSKHIKKINFQTNKEKNKIISYISNNYIEYIKKINKEKISSSKNFYIVLKEKNIEKEEQKTSDILKERLNEKYFKIKECLSRCGNIAIQCDSKEETKRVFKSFLNVKEFLEKRRYTIIYIK